MLVDLIITNTNSSLKYWNKFLKKLSFQPGSERTYEFTSKYCGQAFCNTLTQPTLSSPQMQIHTYRFSQLQILLPLNQLYTVFYQFALVLTERYLQMKFFTWIMNLKF